MAEKKVKKAVEEAVEATEEVVEKKAKPKAKAAKAVAETPAAVAEKKPAKKAATKAVAADKAAKPSKKASKSEEEAVTPEVVSDKQAKAMAKTIRIAARKTRLVLDLIRGKKVGEAFAILRLTPKASSPYVEKVLNSAIHNAEHNFQMNIDRLYVAEAFADEGATLKRFRPRAQGRASAINKRTSHITIIVKEK